jgi:anaphase-promoting complex subunit 3
VDSKIQKPTRTPLTTNFIRVGEVIDQRKRKEKEKEKKDQAVSIAEMVSIIQKIVSAYSALKLFHLKPCLDWLELLPENHYNTGMVLSIVARAYFEQHAYIKASDTFKKIRNLEPFRLDSMDIYGTCLWHLKKKVELSFLGKQLEEIDKVAPQTWCVVGNYFSVLQEYESAIQAFKRAVQVDPHFTYAHTLLGHEYLVNDDLDASAESFQYAFQSNPRHYNAIFGLGLIEKKQEKYLLAEHFFRLALAITPNNSILLDSLASVLAINQVIQKQTARLGEALELYNHVVELSPTQKVYKLHRAQLLFNMEEYEECKDILENEIASCKPESGMYFLLGKTYAKLGMNREAVVAMTMAQDYMEHKSCTMIKDAIGMIY